METLVTCLGRLVPMPATTLRYPHPARPSAISRSGIDNTLANIATNATRLWDPISPNVRCILAKRTDITHGSSPACAIRLLRFKCFASSHSANVALQPCDCICIIDVWVQASLERVPGRRSRTTTDSESTAPGTRRSDFHTPCHFTLCCQR